MRFFKNSILYALLLCACLVGGIILLCRSDPLSPNYVMLECKDGNKYRLQATDAQPLYDRFLYIEKSLKNITQSIRMQWYTRIGLCCKILVSWR